MGSGFQGDGIKTIVPCTATAKLSARLVPGQTPGDIIDKVPPLGGLARLGEGSGRDKRGGVTGCGGGGRVLEGRGAGAWPGPPTAAAPAGGGAGANTLHGPWPRHTPWLHALAATPGCTPLLHPLAEPPGRTP